MSILVYLIVPVALFVFIISVVVWRQRSPSSMDASLKEFQRGLDALRPDTEQSDRLRSAENPVVPAAKAPPTKLPRAPSSTRRRRD